MYAKLMDIHFQGETEVIRAAYNSISDEWEVDVRNEGLVTSIRPKHLVFATGNCSIPNLPSFPGQDSFQGEIVHSSRFTGCRNSSRDWHGKRCIIVGSNTSAHDIAQDLWEHGADVTMLQRSHTCVLKTERVRELYAIGSYSEEGLASGISAAEADLRSESLPYALREASMKAWVETVQSKDAEFYSKLEQVGWKQDWGKDGTGPYMMFIRRFCGYYFDIGASQLLLDGCVKLQSQTEIAEVQPSSVVLSNGNEMPCDFLVLATGYKNMSEWIAKLISPETAEDVGPVWGLGSGVCGDSGPYEGELHNMWKPTSQKGLWFHGGNIKLSRFHSLHLALQLKARFEHLPLKVYVADEDVFFQKMVGA